MKTYGTFGLGERGWVISADPHVLLRMKRVFNKIDKGQFGAVVLSDTTENCRDLVWFMDRYPLDGAPEHQARLKARAEEHLHHEDVLASILGGRFQARAFEMAVAPRDYQAQAAEAILQGKSLLLADDLGLGKTCSAIAALTDPKTRPALVVTMTHLPGQWQKELGKFAPTLSSHVLTRGQPYPLTIDARTKKRKPFPDVVIGSYSKLAGWAGVLAGHIRTVVFDEAQELRHNATDKYNGAKHIADAAEYRVGLTATPIYNYGSEMFNVVDVLRPGVLGTQEEFLREWCSGVKQAHTGQIKACISKPKAFGIYMRDSGTMLRRTRAEVGRELPQCQRIIHHVDADLKALEKIEGKAIELAKIILAQSGTVRGDKLHAAEEFNMRLRQATGVAKAPYVAEFARMVVEGGEPLVLFGWHRDVYSIWMERLKDLKPVLYTGSETVNAKAAAARDFIKGQTNLIIMSLRSGAGLDGLQARCRTGAFGELDWSPAVHDQNIGRWDRDGQKDPTTAYFLLSEHGSDPVVADVLGIKRGQVEGIRNPTSDVVEQVQADPGNIKRLAAAYLHKRGLAPPPGPLPAPPAPRPVAVPPVQAAPTPAAPAPEPMQLMLSAIFGRAG